MTTPPPRVITASLAEAAPDLRVQGIRDRQSGFLCHDPGSTVDIGLYNPYLAALGGGEKYFLSVLEEAARIQRARLTVFSPQEPDVRSWERLNIFVARDRFMWIPADDAVVTARSRELDLLVTMSNDVPVLNHARRGVAMVQFPTRARDTPMERARAALAGAVGRRRAPAALASYQLFLCNSEFTREHIRRRLGVGATIVAPPVDPPLVAGLQKQRRILAVGRFHKGEHDKHQEVLVRAFAQLPESFAQRAGWELHLVGGAEDTPSTRRWLEELRSLARGVPVHFHVNAGRDALAELYATSSLFWHATGYGEDARRHPERLEHFGIATAEAMFCGAVPLVVPLGGQAQIVTDGVTGRHWHTMGELVARTSELIEDADRAQTLRANGQAEARRYGKPRFAAEVRRYVLEEPGLYSPRSRL